MLYKNHSLPVRIIILIFISVLVTGCGLFKKDDAIAKSTDRRVEKFDNFYDRFHRDVDFQMSRIEFPLEGKMIDGNGSHDWTRENWPVMKVRIQDIDKSQFKTAVERGPDSFYQKFWAEDTGFFAEYRFELKGRKWYLVYARDVNL